MIMCLCARRTGRLCACARKSGRSCACVLGGVSDHVLVC